jgi:hypothetical protein
VKRRRQAHRLGLQRTALRRAQQKLAFHAWHDQWFIAYGTCAEVRADACRFETFARLVPPWDRFWADPFPIEQDGAWHVFFEDYSFELGRASIAVVTIGRDGTVSTPRTVLEQPFHLSYPCVFQSEGDHFMVPESRQSGRVELYVAERFPDRWTPAAVLLEGVAAADATLGQWRGLWWMFACISPDGRLENDRLRLFWATSPVGPWSEHRRSPLALDPAVSRPAGRLFAYDGALYRPSQTGLVRYGHQIRLNRVVRLDLDDYVEEPASEIGPSWHSGLRGNHTLNRAGELVCIDGYVRRFRPPRAIGWHVRSIARRVRRRRISGGSSTSLGEPPRHPPPR